MVRPTLLYGMKYWPVKNSHVQKMHVAGMGMLRWICGHIRCDRIINKVVSPGVGIYGKGDWWSISRKFVLSRTPIQVASHVQKFYTRFNDNNNADKRRSIHDVTSAADITEPSQGQKSDKLKGPCGGQLQCPITNYVTEALYTAMLSLPGPVKTARLMLLKGHQLLTRRNSGLVLLQVGPTVNTASLPIPTANRIGVHGCTTSSRGSKDGFTSTMGALVGVFSVDSMQLPSIPDNSGGGTYPVGILAAWMTISLIWKTYSQITYLVLANKNLSLFW
ncbi:Transcription factor MYB1R1 [Capsicum chinense]|nr:Transcription factor MYB1R1 [Capsicum chinense]